MSTNNKRGENDLNLIIYRSAAILIPENKNIIHQDGKARTTCAYALLRVPGTVVEVRVQSGARFLSHWFIFQLSSGNHCQQTIS